MATIVDPRMINSLKPLRIDDARFAYLSANNSEIVSLSSENILTANSQIGDLLTSFVQVLCTTTVNELYSDSIVNNGNITNNGDIINGGSFTTINGTIESLITNNIQNNFDITTNNLAVANDTITDNLTATGNIVTNFSIITADNDYIFSDNDKSKVIHFDTTATIEISAIFPNTLSNGFNVGVINAGSGVIYLSGEQIINAPGLINSEIYTGFFVYKVNGSLFGIGSLE
jgi:hypothetical protein